MPPPQKKRAIADFFKPHARPLIPQKRPSPTSATDENVSREPKHAPKTPTKIARFKNGSTEDIGSSLLSPGTCSSLPISSPNPIRQRSDPPTAQHASSVHPKPTSPRKEPAPTKTSFTFSDISERSNKIVENGKIVGVRDSDDDADSLESLDDIFNRRPAPTEKDSELSSPEDLEAERVKALSVFTNGRSIPIVGKDKLRALQAKEKVVKFDLSTVLDHHFDDEEIEEKILQMRASIADAKEKPGQSELDKNLLASVVRTGDADEDDLEKLLHAVDRTEALSSEKTFAFFIPSSSPKTRKRKVRPLPKAAIPRQLWLPEDQQSQYRAFQSGYVAELVEAGHEPVDELLSWIFDQLLSEQSAELRHAYLQCLKAGSRSWTRLAVTATDVQEIFQHLGAHPECISKTSLIETKSQPLQPNTKQSYDALLTILQTFQLICLDMDFLALSRLCSVVLRLALDNTVMSDANVCSAVEQLFETLLSLPDEDTRSHVYDTLLADATENLKDSQLQVQLLTHILPNGTDAIVLRETLADAFLFGPSIIDPDNKTSNATLNDLVNLVSTSPLFSATRRANSTPTDYTNLTSLVRILDTAISSGTPPSPSPSLIVTLKLPPTTPNTPSPSIPQKPSSSSRTTEFNATTDTLADKIHTLFVSIKDTGASHMRRTEAKDALNALYFRLLFSVRTRPRKKRHVFDPHATKAGSTKTGTGRWVTGEEHRETQRGGDFMKRFLGSKAKESNAAMNAE